MKRYRSDVNDSIMYYVGLANEISPLYKSIVRASEKNRGVVALTHAVNFKNGELAAIALYRQTIWSGRYKHEVTVASVVSKEDIVTMIKDKCIYNLDKYVHGIRDWRTYPTVVSNARTEKRNSTWRRTHPLEVRYLETGVASY